MHIIKRKEKLNSFVGELLRCTIVEVMSNIDQIFDGIKKKLNLGNPFNLRFQG